MRYLIAHIVLLFVALHTYAQKPVVFLDVEPKDAEVGEILTITVKSNVHGEVDIDFPSGFVHGYNIMNGMETELDVNTGKLITYYYLSQTGAMSKAGTFKFGPAFVKKGNRAYKSNPVSVTINKENIIPISGDDITSKQLRQPAFAIIQKSKSVIYEGESVVLNAKIYSRFSPSFIENYQPYSLDGVLDKYDIGTSSRIVVDQEKVRQTTLFSFVYDKKVLFPIGTGKMTIDPFKLILRRNYESMPLTSSSTMIEVKPLPGNVPKDFIGGVGQFTITRSVSPGPYTQGDVFTMTIEISGYGNLQNIIEPKLNLPKGFIVYGDPIIKEDFVYGSKGAEGKITYEYNIQLNRFGKLTIPETTVSFFDLTKEKYVQIVSGNDQISVIKNDKFKNSEVDSSLIIENQAKDELFPMRRDDNNKNLTDLLIKSPVFWLGLSSPLLIGFVLGLFRRRKEQNSLIGEQKQAKRKTQLEIEYLFTEAENALKDGNISAYCGLIEKGIQRSMALFLKNDDAIVMSKSEIFSLLEQRNIDKSKLVALKTLFSICENARYGMGMDGENQDNLVNEAKQIIQSIVRS